ncbi:MAG TPA: DUF5700 domain-containing putative Zn-dependent protease [Gemmatimonadaceae bacterium]|nr:DUF5700 domain-containing putative Zn-dependent protease [Gemmatimonadaceae bacterium]
MQTRRLATVIMLAGFAAIAHAQASSTPPYPSTGLDFAAVDGFWRVTDILRADKDPSPAEWSAFLGTPGERLAQIVLGDAVREDLELAFKPSRRAAFDSLTKLTNDRATRLTHLVRASTLRPQLTAFRDSMARSAPVAEALKITGRYLPPGATSRGAPPLVAFAVFRNDGYSLGPGVVVDLLNAYEADLVLFLAHEFHHTYLSRAEAAAVPRTTSDGQGSPDAGLRGAIQALRNEGIADLIDKPHPLAWPNPIRASYVKRYNDEYDKTPATLRQLDSLLVAVADDSTQLASAGQRARTLLWSNSHANGGYIARTIYEQFGIDSLFPAVVNPAALLRTYVAAEKARGNADPFSPKGWSVIESFERRYWLPR